MSLSLSAMLLLATPAAGAPVLPDAADAESAPSDRVFIMPRMIRLAQVRIEQRIIIRVPARRQPNPGPITDTRRIAPTYVEKKIGKCLSMNNILGVQRFGGRVLDLVTKDRRRIRARLEKKCQARSFYSGFYMEKSKDGRMCVKRDLLHSRTGSKCEIDRFRELVRE